MTNNHRVLKYNEALNEALSQGMDRDPGVFVMGCGVDDEGGIFGTTTEAFKNFGPDRVIDAPLAENAIAGIGVGASILGKRPVIVHARNDFLLLAMDQIINHAAKWKIMSGGKLSCPVVFRAVVGRGWGQAAQHSQSLQALFCHPPGINVVLPSSPYDAKGLLLSSLKADDPVVMIEHRLLFNSQDSVPLEPYEIPLGKGDIKKHGSDVTVVAFSFMVKESLEAATKLSDEGIDVEVIDPRCANPLDIDLILESVSKTGRLLIADTGWKQFGVSAEICSLVQEKGFHLLKAPIVRIGLPHRNTPCNHLLEKDFYPGVEDLYLALKSLMGHLENETNRAKIHSPEHIDFQGPF